MKRIRKRIRLQHALGISFGAYLLLATCCTYAAQYTVSEMVVHPIENGSPDQKEIQHHIPSENVERLSSASFWLDCRFFQEWRELLNKTASTQRPHASIAQKSSLHILTRQELDYQYAFLAQQPAEFVVSPPILSIFQITERTLQKLHEAGVPDGLLCQLESLKGVEFTGQNQFWKAVEQQIEQSALLAYRMDILTYSGGNENMLPPGTSIALDESLSKHLSRTSLENTAAWETLLYYPGAAKKALSSPETHPSAHTVSENLDDSQDLFNIRRLFKRWGIPKPSTLILTSLGLYLALALLNRR